MVEDKCLIVICRVKCHTCLGTHALLPSYVVPYSQILLDDQIDIIDSFESLGTDETITNIEPVNPQLDISHVRYLISQYIRHWQQRLLSQNITFDLPLKKFIPSCFEANRRQFMQIKRTPNALFLDST